MPIAAQPPPEAPIQPQTQAQFQPSAQLPAQQKAQAPFQPAPQPQNQPTPAPPVTGPALQSTGNDISVPFPSGPPTQPATAPPHLHIIQIL